MLTRRFLGAFAFAWILLAAIRVAANVAVAGPGADVEALAMRISAIAMFWIPVPFVAFAIDRSRLARRTWTLLAAHVAVALAVVLIEPAWVRTILQNPRPVSYATLAVIRIDVNVLVYAVVVAADVAWLRWCAFRSRERAAARLEQMLNDAQLHALALQLQPHFLFNALQFVAETAHDDLDTARRTLRQLRGLLEQAFALEHRREVTVAEELSFLEAYGDIQRRRFGDRFTLRIAADPAVLQAAVPPLLLQPLVENAVRHGFGRRARGGAIEVGVSLSAGMLHLVVSDDGDGLSPRMSDGQGLSVTRRRLERLHGPQARLTIERDAGRTVARIVVPMRPLVADAGTTAVADVDDAPDAILATRPTGLDRIPFAARIAAVWVVLVGAIVTSTYVVLRLQPYEGGTPAFQSLFLEEMIGIPFWVMISILATRRWSIARHAAAAIAMALLHASLGHLVATELLQQRSAPGRFIQWAPWHILVYATILLMTRARDLRRWVGDKVRQEIVLGEQVQAAAQRLARLREKQGILLGAFDDVIASPTIESLDRAVIDFADFIRVEIMSDAAMPIGEPA